MGAAEPGAAGRAAECRARIGYSCCILRGSRLDTPCFRAKVIVHQRRIA
jgi:hypothetical protein